MTDRIWTILWDLLVPAALLVWGIWLVTKPPKDVGNSAGYRTKRSSINRETWNFAQNYAGKVWIILGGVMLPISLAVALYAAYNQLSEVVDLVLAVAQIAIIALAFIPIENALKKRFDDRGRRKKG